jgi:hypothetical protein
MAPQMTYDAHERASAGHMCLGLLTAHAILGTQLNPFCYCLFCIVLPLTRRQRPVPDQAHGRHDILRKCRPGEGVREA